MPTAYENILKLIEDGDIQRDTVQLDSISDEARCAFENEYILDSIKKNTITCSQVLGISAPAARAFRNDRIVSLIKRGDIPHDQAFDISSCAVAAFSHDKTYDLIQLEVISINDALEIQSRQLNMFNNLDETYLIYKLLKDKVLTYDRYKNMRRDDIETFRRQAISDVAIAAFKSENILQLIDNDHISYRRVFDISDAELSLIDSDSIVQLILVDNASCDQVLKMSKKLSQVFELLDVDTGNRYSDAASQDDREEALQAESQKYLPILGALLTVIATAQLGLSMPSVSSENDQLIFRFLLSFSAIGVLSMTGYQHCQSNRFFQRLNGASSNNPITEIFNVTLKEYKSYVLELIQNDHVNTMNGAFTLCFLALMSDPISNRETILACLDHISSIDSTLSAIVAGILLANFSNEQLSMNPIFKKIKQKCRDEGSQRIFRKIEGQESIMGLPSQFSMYRADLSQQTLSEQDKSPYPSYP